MSDRDEGLTNFQDLGGLDPAVEAIIQEGNRRSREARLPLRERKKKIRERRKNKSRRGRRAVYDLDPELISAVKAIADEHSIPASQVSALLLTLGLEALKQVNLNELKIPSDSPRYDWNLDLERLET